MQQEQESVESAIYCMDRERDGHITEADFVQGVREAGAARFRLTRYKEEILLTSLMLAGFVLYQVRDVSNSVLLCYTMMYLYCPVLYCIVRVPTVALYMREITNSLHLSFTVLYCSVLYLEGTYCSTVHARDK